MQAASGTKTITVETAGEYYYGLTCGGVESGLAELIVGSNRAASAASVQGPNPPQVIVGNALTLDATVASASGKGPTPTGTVAFSGNGGYFFTYPLSDGGATATFSTAMLTPEYLSMSVTYSGDSNYLPSSSGTPAVVLVQGTPAVIVTVPAVIGEDQPLTVSANVLPVNNGPIPTGTVTFTAPYGSPIRGGTVPLTNGKATITSYSSTAQQGPVLALASYSGDTYYVAAQGSALYTVEANTLISLTVSPNPVSEGQTTTLLATLTATSGISPTGTVTFSIPGLVIGTATVSNGAAMLSASSAGVPPGTYAVTATYSGDLVNGPATSAAVNVKVTAP